MYVYPLIPLQLYVLFLFYLYLAHAFLDLTVAFLSLYPVPFDLRISIYDLVYSPPYKIQSVIVYLSGKSLKQVFEAVRVNGTKSTK